MSWLSRVVEVAPSVRWRMAQVASTVIYPRAFARFGQASVLVRPLVLRGVSRISIGSSCAIYEGAWLACEEGGGPLEIGDGTYLGHRVHLHADAPLRIGQRCVLADDVFIATTDHVRGDRSHSQATGPVRIGDDVFIGQRAVVLGGVSIGDGATIGAHAVVTRDVAAGDTVVGVPARPVPRREPGASGAHD